jgi:maltose alpha-D-glucosyltransferase/alpha-amylase
VSTSWLHGAVVYAIDVASFFDSDGDGWGDLSGVSARLDHVARLGANCIWVQPFNTSPRRDDGYDVADYLTVDPRLGELTDVAELIDHAHDLGLRVIFDLVINHTSRDHPWFQSARADPGSPFRSYYVWRSEPDDALEVQPIFPGVSDDVWIWDESAGQYYLSRFYDHEPDLDTGNPDVLDEIEKIMAFWLDYGIDGFRIDAAPYLVEKAAWSDPREGGHWVLRRLKQFVADHSSDAVLVGETDVEPSRYEDFMGDGHELDGLLDFFMNNHLFLALAREESGPLADALRQRPPSLSGTLMHWVRNHDELDLERLSDAEREEVYARFAPDESQRIYGRGIRRRYPPMVDGDPLMLRLAYQVAFSLPGIPVLRHGEEIGMGDDLSQTERLAVRTAMQWSAGPGAGFSSAPAELRVRPVIESGPFGAELINVEAQQNDGDSLLNWFRKLIRARREAPEIAVSCPEVLQAPEQLLALRYPGDERDVLVVHNFSRNPGVLELDAGDTVTGLFPEEGPVPNPLHIAGYDSRWMIARPPQS